MWHRGKQFLFLYGPIITLGLFGGRFLSELAPMITRHSLVGALIATTACVIFAVVALRGKPFSRAWPLLFLLIYIVQPDPNPATAVFTLLFVTAIFSFNLIRPWPVIIPLLITAVAFASLYIATLAPDILPADNGEFQLIAPQLGVAHPPGFSLYTLLAHLMTRLPLDISPAVKVNLFSALTSVLTLSLVYATIFRLTRGHGAALSAVLALGASTTFWAQATTANIRSLTGLFAAAMIYALVRFREAVEDERLKTKRLETTRLKGKDFWLALFALALGLGITHHASLVFMGAVFLVFVSVVDFSFIKQPQRWLRPFLAGLLGLLPLLYFPLRAGSGARGASAGLATASGFLNHVLALGFRGDFFYFIEPSVLWQRFQVMGNVLTFQFSPWVLAGMGVGLILTLWRDRKLALLLGGSFALHTFITATYRAPQTVEYMLPATIPMAILLGVAPGYVAGRQGGKVAERQGDRVAKWQGGKVTAVFSALMFVAAVRQGWQHYPSFAFLHRDHTARDYAQTLLTQAPPDSVILADWHWATPLWYLQEVEGQRPDVATRFVFPEGDSYAATWARRIGEEWENGRSVIATHFDENAYATLPVPEPLGDAFLFRQQPRAALPDDFQPLDFNLGQNMRILGYQLNPNKVEIGQETTLTIAWQPAISSQPPATTPLFAHLISADGNLFAQDDLRARPQRAGITLTQFRLTPRLGAAPGDFAVMVGTPGEGDGRVPIATLPVAAMSQPPVTQNPVYRTVPSGRPLLRLIGYDWDNTLPDRPRLYLHWQTEQGYQTEIRDNPTPDALSMPTYFGPWGLVIHNSQFTIHNSQFYVPFGQGIVWTGEPFSLQPSTASLRQIATFQSGRPVLRDLVVSARLIGFEEDGFHWAWWDLADSVPAMGAIPTLKWIAGSTVRSPHTLAVDPAARPGQTIGATLRVYDAFTNRPLPILDDRITNELQLSWIPLGQTVNPAQ